jgi:hypothetical protein
MNNHKLPVILRAICVIGVIGGFASPAFAAFSKVGTTAAPFLKISVGRPTGMGDAFVAIADDPAAVFFNPAGLAQLGEREVMINHIAWIAGMNHEYLSGILPVSGIGTVGLSVTALGTGNMELTQIDDLNSPAREDAGMRLNFSGTDIAVTATYARRITEKLNFGLSVKAVNQTIWNTSASGVGADVGLLYNTGFRSLRVGAAVANFGADMSFNGLNLDFVDSTWQTRPAASYKSTPAPMPITFRFGLGYDIVDADKSKLVAALDLVHPADINETINLGLEYGYAGTYFARAGYIFNTDATYSEEVGWQQGLSAGAGIRFKPVSGLNMKLDYGYRNQGWLGSTHRVSLAVGF